MEEKKYKTRSSRHKEETPIIEEKKIEPIKKEEK